MEKPKNHALIKRLIFVGLLSTLFWSFLLLYSNAIISPHILHHPPLITPQSNAFIVITRPTITTSSADEQTQDSTPTSTSTPTDAGIDTESPSISTGNSSSTSPPPPNTTGINNDPCSGKYIYVHDLPPRFNDDILKQCDSIIPWSNVCKFVSNAGLGPKLMTGKQESDDGTTTTTRPKSSLVPEGRWYASDQYSVEVIFRNRMKQYECLTRDSSKASAVYVPFYAGFDIARYLWDKHNVSVRDSTSLDLIRWLTNAPEWKLMGGKDHFLVVGRTTYDFRRLTDNDSDWGNKLFILPESRNMSFLLVEASPWDTNDFGIPFPTYFHPTKDSDVFLWQSRVRRHSRKWLFSFVGAPRPGNPYSIRTQLINQCKNSSVCNLLSCASKQGHRCHSPRNVMRVFQTSTFCLQPPGDSYTRRSVFDSMLAGCIPVFFHPGTAYVQYRWHLPTNYSSYSVFIPEEDVREGKVRVEEVLRRVGSKEVEEMRERIVGMIPSFLYADPRSAKLETVKDAFDVTVEAVIQRVNTLRLLNEGILEEGKQDEVGDKWDRYFIKGQRRS